MVSVPVIKAFDHEGRSYTVGDMIEVEPVTAAILARRGVVTLSRGYRPPAAKVRGRYNRKDVVADR